MSLISLIVVLCVIGVILYLVNTYLPDPMMKKIINIVVVIVVVLWILQVFGLLSSVNAIHVGN